MVMRNPKQVGTDLFDCRIQTGQCPNACNQCFYNRDGAYYQDINQPAIPTPEEVGDGIVRMNCGHDSNIQKDTVIATAQKYRHFFFNTSMNPRKIWDFPGPVVLTLNPHEEEPITVPAEELDFLNLMFIRLRVSPTNLPYIIDFVHASQANQLPIVLTFMAYYDQLPPGMIKVDDTHCRYLESPNGECLAEYEWKVRHINSYWCPSPNFIAYVLERLSAPLTHTLRNVSVCGTLEYPKFNYYCKDCRNCETYYWQTRKRMKECEWLSYPGEDSHLPWAAM